MRATRVAQIDEHDSTPSDVQAACTEAVTDSVYAARRSAVDVLERRGNTPTVHTDNATPTADANKRRQIPPQSGRALEMLGHAIEYLADEFVFHGGTFATLPAEDSQVRAIQLLMAANRSVYYECPIALTFRERFRRLWLHRVTKVNLAGRR
jgi:hypothetical protein